MIAYFILVHRYPAQFKKLFTAIYDRNNHYLIHLDRRSGAAMIEEIAEFIKAFPNTSMLESENIQWGGYSLVDAELKGMKRLLELDVEWEFFINLSGQDFPLKSQQYITNFLSQHIGSDFMKLQNQQTCRPDTMHRIENYVTETEHEIKTEPVVTRDFLKNVTPYIGNQWVILSRSFCEFLSTSQEVDRFKDFYAHTLIADEGFFQTVIKNTSFKPQIINDDMREIDWVPMGDVKLRPRDYLISDATALLASHNLFARKFDELVDAEIITHLAKHIENAQAQSVALDNEAEVWL